MVVPVSEKQCIHKSNDKDSYSYMSITYSEYWQEFMACFIFLILAQRDYMSITYSAIIVCSLRESLVLGILLDMARLEGVFAVRAREPRRIHGF